MDMGNQEAREGAVDHEGTAAAVGRRRTTSLTVI
jgi:hypothetical protein